MARPNLLVVVACLLSAQFAVAGYSGSAHSTHGYRPGTSGQQQKNSARRHNQYPRHSAGSVNDYRPIDLSAPDNWVKIQGEINYWYGVPYLWGGESRAGIDCSFLVQQIYRSVGVTLPRTSYDQFAAADFDGLDFQTTYRPFLVKLLNQYFCIVKLP